MQRLNVWAEHIEGFILVGTLSFNRDGDERFSYDEEYLARMDAVPAFPILPLQDAPFDTQTTRAAFASLGPEGVVGHDIRTALRAGREAITPLLARLNHETVGALTFTEPGGEPSREADDALPIGDAFLRSFSANPEQTAFKTLMESRLSLNGSVSKIGVVQQGDTWAVPHGLAPSTHILKAGSPAFPHQMLNEALCMRTARLCGFDDAAETKLVAVEEGDPILASRRFDRTDQPDRPRGLPSVMRLHQADFCQLLAISDDALKYTPADELVEGYTSSIASLISQESAERYGDRSYVFDAQVFNYAIGNCDNHLKNLSMTWTPDWQIKRISPVYDISCTTIYPDLSRDMGLGIGSHRNIDQIVPEDFPLMARQLGVNWRYARNTVSELADTITPSLMMTAHTLEVETGIASEALAERLASDAARRLDVLRQAAQL